MFQGYRAALIAALVACVMGCATAAAAQMLDGPFTLAGGRLVVGGDVSAAVSSKEPGFFNYTDYEHDALRLLRLNIAASFRAASRVQILGELRVENTDKPSASALYVRVRPWLSRPIDIQAGRIPPNFGTFARHRYGIDQPLIGYPLAYQYLTSLRPDALPASADDLLEMRGRGWLVSYPLGSESAEHGVPLVSGSRWDTGVQVRFGARPVEASVGMTTGTLSNPLVGDDNNGRQMSGRLGVEPIIGLILGLSGARGEYVSQSAIHAIGLETTRSGFTQEAIGLDAEYSRDYWLVRGEAIWSRWRLPAIDAPFLDAPLHAFGGFVEARYKLLPSVYVAARLDRLTFSRISGSDPYEQNVPWDAPVSRIEVGGGYYLVRNLIGKLTYQHNWRDTNYGKSVGQIAAQLVFWF